ncbi:MAG: hypothetical protein QXL22_03790 [Candidatus Nezhaarchaeales archaeon]
MSVPQPQTQSRIRLQIYPSEMRYVKPLETIANYIRSKTRGERVSRHHIARIFNPLEEFLAGSGGKADTVAKIMDLFARHYGFADEQERNTVKEAAINLVDYVAMQKSINPVGAFKMLKNMRILLIGLATGLLSSVSIEPLEKKS